MPSEIEKEFIKKALDIFHGVQKNIQPNDFDQQVKELYEFIEGTPEHNKITLEDLKYAIKDDIYFQWETTIYNVSDERFVNRFKSTVLTYLFSMWHLPLDSRTSKLG